MWGILIRIAGARVEADVPGWLLNAAATQVAIDQIQRVAHELAARPDQYGFDPDAMYTLLFQTWDRATSRLRSVAFGRDRDDQSAVGLLPDPYYMYSRGYRTLRRDAGALPAWKDRSSRVAWRGSVTGDNTIARAEDLPRIRLAMLCRDNPNMDVGLIGVHSTMNNGREPGSLDTVISTHGLIRDRWDMARFGQHRFTIDIDGHANAWGLLEKFILGCCVLKVASPYEQWFYNRLKPWQHYVPIRDDLSDLADKVDWCRANEEQCRWIARNGMQLAASLTLRHEVPAMCDTVLKAAHARRSSSSIGEIVLTTPRFMVEDAVTNAEDSGWIDEAILELSRLIDDGDTRWETLMRRHDYFRQRGNFFAAQTDMETAVAAAPGADEPPLRLAQFYALIGRHVDAVPLFEKARALAPNRIEIAVGLVASCLKLGWLDRAFRVARGLPADLPGWWADVRRDALAAYEAARAELASSLSTTRKSEGLSTSQCVELATLLTKLGRIGLAQRISDLLSPVLPNQGSSGALARAIVMRRVGPAAALYHLEQDREADDASAAYLSDAAELLYQAGDYSRVLEKAHQAGLADAPLRLLELAACSAAMLGRRTEVAQTCSVWMARSPGDYKPAELLCGAQPIPAGALTVPDREGYLQIGHFVRTEALSKPIEAALESWKGHHRDAQQNIFDVESARAFLVCRCDVDVVRAYDLCNTVETKAHYFRLAWLYQNGGCWIGSDQRCIRPAGEILAAAMTSDLTTIRSGHMTGYIQDHLIAAQMGSTLMEAACKEATAAILRAAERGEPLWAWDALGAGLLTRLAASALARADERAAVRLLAPMTYDSFAATVPLG